MVEVTLSATVMVQGGPRVPVGLTLKPETCAYATVVLEKKDDHEDVPLLPATGTPSLLAISAVDDNNKPVKVGVKPTDGANAAGSEFEVDGTLIIANSAVLAALHAPGVRGVTVTNKADGTVKVQILAGVGAEESND